MTDDRYDRGIAVRRQVLGDAHVDASLVAAAGFNRECKSSSPATAGAISGTDRG